MEIKPWFEREFNFDVPIWMCPNVVERLRGGPARAADLVAEVSEDILTRGDGFTWTAQENIGHLVDAEPLWLGRVCDILDGKPRLRDADLTNRKTHEANHNSRRIDEILTEFRAIRSKFVAQLDELESSDFEKTAIHPRLEQPMRVLDLILFVAEHDDHHFAHVTRLKALFRTG